MTLLSVVFAAIGAVFAVFALTVTRKERAQRRACRMVCWGSLAWGVAMVAVYLLTGEGVLVWAFGGGS